MTTKLNTIDNLLATQFNNFNDNISTGSKAFGEANKILAALNNLDDLNNEPKYSQKAVKYGYNWARNTTDGIRDKLTNALDKIGVGLNAFSEAEKILINKKSYTSNTVQANLYKNLTEYFEAQRAPPPAQQAPGVAVAQRAPPPAQQATGTPTPTPGEQEIPEQGAEGAGGGGKKSKKDKDGKKKKYRGGSIPNFAIDLPGFENVGGLLNNAAPYQTALQSISAMSAPQSFDAGYSLSTSSSAGLPDMYRAVSDGNLVNQSGGKSKKNKDKKVRRGGNYLDANAKSYELISGGMENVKMNGGKKNKSKN